MGTGLLGAGVAVTAAGLAGITSGDPSKAAQYDNSRYGRI